MYHSHPATPRVQPPFYSSDQQRMFSRIKHGKLSIPHFVSIEATSLLQGLLQKDPKKRLGGDSADAEVIRRHPFFRPVDWEKLYRKEVEVPFVS